jgi:phage baseplate assembly protein W
MQQEFYALPVMFESLMRGKEHPKCDLQQSVFQHLHLILSTSFGGFPADETFGCGIWDHDFDNVTGALKLKELFRQSLLQSITEQEPRLGNVRVEVLLKQEEQGGENDHKVKKRIDVTVTGVLQSTNERFSYRDRFFVGPLSY